MNIKIFKNSNPVEKIICGSGIFKKFKEVNLSALNSLTFISPSVKIVEDTWLKEDNFIGVDANMEWVFSYITVRSVSKEV